MKYRIVAVNGGFAIEERHFLCWSYMTNVWGIPPLYKTMADAEAQIVRFVESQKKTVVKELCL